MIYLLSCVLFVDKEVGCCSTHLIEGDGTFNAEGLDNFIKQVEMAECGLSYPVVAIMGPQSSGMLSIIYQKVTYFTILNQVIYPVAMVIR